MEKKTLPYTVRITHVPHPGKGPELRAALEERSKTANASGGRYNLTQRLYTKEPAFINGLQYDNLAALEAYQASAPNDPTRQAQIEKIQSLSTLSAELFENLAVSATNGPRSYNLRITSQPVFGKAGELRKTLENWVHTPSPGAVGRALSVKVTSSDGPTFTTTTGFASLAALGEFRASAQTDPAFQAFQAQIADLLAKAPSSELERVWVPFPAR